VEKPKNTLNILIIDDNRLQRKIISTMVLASKQVPITANGHEQALACIEEENIDLILMDIEMPEVDGYALTSIIRKNYSRWIPIIFLSANDSEESLIKGIDAGGDDYLIKPVKEVILSAKIRAMNRLSNMQRDLDAANKKLATLSCIDPLTQLLNRRGLDQVLQSTWSLTAREKSEFSLLMIGIDYFKPYNDNYGHQQGDKCLKQVSGVLSLSLSRSTDVAARYGGEEFILVLPATSIKGAEFKAKEIITRFENAQLKHKFSAVSDIISVSIGVTSTRFSAHNIEQLIKQSDKALYQAKKRGRNRCITYKT
jgi:diguanylate cyclase (GGDEF)-like protein